MQQNLLWIFLDYKTSNGSKKHWRGFPGWPPYTTARLPLQARPSGLWSPRGHPAPSLTSTPSLLDHVRSKNHAPEGFIPFGIRLIFLFCETLKQGKKQKLALGSGSIG